MIFAIAFQFQPGKCPDCEIFANLCLKLQDRFSPGLGRSLAAVARLLGDIWSNTVVVVTHWAYDQAAVTRRRRLRIRENKYR